MWLGRVGNSLPLCAIVDEGENMISVFLGAGFSKWAADLPLASELFDFNIGIINERDEKRLNTIIQWKEQWDTNNPTGYSEQFIKKSIDANTRKKNLVTWYITRRLAEPFIGTITRGYQTLMIDDKRVKSIEGVQRAKSFIYSLKPLSISGIMTCNYDMLIEYALGTNGFNYGSDNQILTGRGKNPVFPWQGLPVCLTGDIKLAKLHGSISWNKGHYYTDGRCGLRGDALIVPPAPEKRPPLELKEVWNLGNSILRSSDRLIVFGFAFNQYDVALLDFLRLSGANLAKILLIDLKPNISVAKSLWPGAEIEECMPQFENNPIFKDWISKCK